MTGWAQFMLLWSWQSLIVMAMILLLVRIVRPASAGERHRLWLLGSVVVAMLPLANFVARSRAVPLPTLRPLVSIAQLPAEIGISITAGGPASAGPAAAKSPLDLSRRWPVIAALFSLWSAGVLVCLARSFRSYWKSRRMRSRARRIAMPGVAAPVGYSTEVRSPLLAGILHPMILLPESLEGWASPEERQAILLHEMAHLGRRDHVASLLQAFVGALLFFHPAIRYALRQLVLERELACDEQVLARGALPAIYAHAILKAAQHGITQQQSYYPTFSSSGRILERRIHMIRTNRLVSDKRRWLPAASAAAIVGLALLLLPRGAVTAQPQQPEATAKARIEVAPVAPSLLRESSVKTIESAAVIRRTIAPATPLTTAIGAQVQTFAGAPLIQFSGTISDQSGAVIPGVTVALSNADGTPEQTVVTNELGAYIFPQATAGAHIFQVSLPGFATHKRTILLKAGWNNTQNARLQIGGTSIAVDVVTQRPSTQVPAPAPSSQGPVRIGGLVAAPRLLYSPKPSYPPLARERGIQSYVSLLGIVDITGQTQSLRPDLTQGSGDVELVQAAVNAVKQWRFEPAALNGSPVEFPVTVTVNFLLVD